MKKIIIILNLLLVFSFSCKANENLRKGDSVVKTPNSFICDTLFNAAEFYASSVILNLAMNPKLMDEMNIDPVTSGMPIESAKQYIENLSGKNCLMSDVISGQPLKILSVKKMGKNTFIELAGEKVKTNAGWWGYSGFFEKVE